MNEGLPLGLAPHHPGGFPYPYEAPPAYHGHPMHPHPHHMRHIGEPMYFSMGLQNMPNPGDEVASTPSQQSYPEGESQQEEHWEPKRGKTKNKKKEEDLDERRKKFLERNRLAGTPY